MKALLALCLGWENSRGSELQKHSPYFCSKKFKHSLPLIHTKCIHLHTSVKFLFCSSDLRSPKSTSNCYSCRGRPLTHEEDCNRKCGPQRETGTLPFTRLQDPSVCAALPIVGNTRKQVSKVPTDDQLFVIVHYLIIASSVFKILDGSFMLSGLLLRPWIIW